LPRIEQIAVDVAEQEVGDRIPWRVAERALAVIARLQRIADLLLREAQAKEAGAAEAVVRALAIGDDAGCRRRDR
jgi:hypothetical protein